MLRISEYHDVGGVRLVVEGHLRGPWVVELEGAVASARAALRGRGGACLTVDVSEVRFLDEAGRALLATLCAAGVTLVAHGPWMSGVLEDLARGR